MIYSEEIERQRRFILSIEILIPFILVVASFCIIFFKGSRLDWDDLSLLILLFLCYVYYVVHLIYFGFKKTSIDPITRVFTREETNKLIKKAINHKKIHNIGLLRILNIKDINDRYGYENSDNILREFVAEFSNFMDKNGFNKIPIGKVTNGNLIFIVKSKNSKLEHILRTFVRKIANEGIKDVEIKVDFAVVLDNYDKDPLNIINALFFKVNHKDDDSTKVIKTDVVEDLVCYAIENERFEFKFQTIKAKNSVDENYLNLSVKLNSADVGSISKNRVLDIARKKGYEIKYDLAILNFLCKSVDFSKIQNRIFVEISAISLRNVDFKNFILEMISKEKIQPKKIVFEFYENEICSEIFRFSEILAQYRKMGFKIALNQFGGKNASFEYFKYLPIDFIIYDIEFNKNLKNKKFKEIFDCYNEICNNLDIKSVIRFIDKKPFYDELLKTKIDYIQGFYIDKPTSLKGLK